MKQWWQKIIIFRLLLVVFGAGLAVMALELAGSRLMAPYFGTSIITWTSLIGIVMTSLSVGYYLGGKLADHYQSHLLLAIILFSASMMVTWVLWSSYLILPLTAGKANFTFYCIISSLIIFAPASCLLAMVSPYAVRLSLANLASAGSLVGAFSALSTAGSIVGTFLAGLALIPVLGTKNLIFSLAWWVLILAWLAWQGPKKYLLIISAVIIVINLAAYFSLPQLGALVDRDTAYNRVWIIDSAHNPWGPEPMRLMQVNNEWSSGKYLANNELLFPYTRYYDLGEHLVPDFNQALLIGGAGYSYPKHFLRRYPKARLDVVEIDPGLTALAKEYFDLQDDSRLRIFHQDARLFLNQSQTRYDLIYGDAFVSMSLPFHLTTKETVTAMHRQLNDHGAILVNLIGSLEGEQSDLARAEYATFKSVFDQVYLVPVSHPETPRLIQNLILIALKSDVTPNWSSDNELFAKFLAQRYQGDLSGGLIMTDDFAPVEYFTVKALSKK